MSETIKISRAEVTTLKKGVNDVLKEIKIEKDGENKGSRFVFKVQTRVNDRVDNSPRLFRRCSYYVNTEEIAQKVKDLVKLGAVLDVEGKTNRKSFKPEDGDTVYYDEVDVSGFTAIQTAEVETASDDDLPF